MMNKAKQTRLALSMLVAAGGVGSYAVTPSAHAVNESLDRLGDALIFPYYTTNAGWLTAFSVTNTRDYTVALKFRFLEADNSRDVLDFNVIMSPDDVFVGYVTDTGDGPEFRVASGDTTCTSPRVVNGLKLNKAAYSDGNSDGGSTDLARLTEGHVTVVMMGHTAANGDDGDIGLHANHNSPAFNCDIVDNRFLKSNIEDTRQQFGEPINSLRGEYSLLNVALGRAAAGTAVTLANFFNISLNDDHPQGRNPHCVGIWTQTDGAPNSCPNLITAQEPFDFLDPTLNDAWTKNGQSATAGGRYLSDRNNGDLRQAFFERGVDAVSFALQRSAVINQWSVNPDLGVKTDWVVTFPTKNFYVDFDPSSVQAALSNRRADLYPKGHVYKLAADNATIPVPYPPFAEWFQGKDNDNGRSCDEVLIRVIDREEMARAGGGTVPSPAPVEPIELCRETNVITFTSNGTGGDLLGSPQSVDVDVSALPLPFGWMELNFKPVPHNGWIRTTDIGNNGMSYGFITGKPVVGFMIQEKSFGEVTKNYALLTDHSYRRPKDVEHTDSSDSSGD